MLTDGGYQCPEQNLLKLLIFPEVDNEELQIDINQEIS